MVRLWTCKHFEDRRQKPAVHRPRAIQAANDDGIMPTHTTDSAGTCIDEMTQVSHTVHSQVSARYGRVITKLPRKYTYPQGRVWRVHSLQRRLYLLGWMVDGRYYVYPPYLANNWLESVAVTASHPGGGMMCQ